MNISRYWWMLLGATASGLLAGYVALVYVSKEPAPLQAAVPTQTIVVAARDLPAGAIVRREDVETVDWPGSALPEGVATQAGEVVGRGLITEIKKNEALLDAKLAQKEAGGGMSITIPEGMRAVSVEVDEVIGVAGFVLPGTRVDVLVTVMPGNDRSRTTTRIILQNIRAIAADQKYQQDVDGEPQYVTVVTLLVSPQQAEELTLAATEGRIQLALRNTLDSEVVDTQGRRITSLIAGGSAAQTGTTSSSAATPVAPERTIESYEGGRRTLLKFGRGGGGQ
ncbi:MAG: Flp pilus assembly protein CpaB [Gemmatimonadota bacterium]|nr:Flp pilus assembly protein CpaB [Gemmatimonadota bacterium]